MKNIIKLFIKYGDKSSTDLAISLVKSLNSYKAEEFQEVMYAHASGKRGSFESRNRALMFLSEYGLKKPLKIWKEEGKMIEVAVIKTKINYEAKPLPKGITRESYLEMISAVDSKCPEKGEKMVKQLLQIAPNDPMLLNSLCLAYANQGKHKETEELTRKISIDNPSYLPAKLTIISLEIKNGNYEIANELLFEVMQTEEIHYQDFNRYLRLSMNLAWLKKDYSELKRLMKLSREHGLDDKVQEYEEMLHTVKMNEIYN